jgi:hypothetical protein
MVGLYEPNPAHSALVDRSGKQSRLKPAGDEGPSHVERIAPLRKFIVANKWLGAAALLVLFTASSVWATSSGTAEEARAMLDKAIAAVRTNKAKALEMFNNGEGGFKDRDLYVSCANASDGVVTAHPTGKGAQLRDIKDERGFAFGEEIMRTAIEGRVNKVTYLWRRPGSDKPAEKTSFFTKVGGQICGVGYYK